MERERETGAPRRRWWWIAIALLVLTPLGVAGARQLAPTGGSPATGSAQVITQGIARIANQQMAWRLVERTALPRAQAKATRRALGFVLASDEPILLTNAVPDGGTEDIARLAPGEAFLVKDGTRQVRASLTDLPVKYLALELVVADEVDDIGSGTLLYKSDPFDPPTGDRDLDLVRNVIELGERASLPDTGGSTVILATDGAIDILPDGGRARTLQAGESAMFEAGELEIESVEPDLAGARLVPAAAMTNHLAQGSTGGAAYVVAVIGEEIPPPPTPTPTPTNTPTNTPEPTATTEPTEEVEATATEETPVKESTATPTPTEEPDQIGSISVNVFNCPPGMTPSNLVGDACSAASDGFDFLLSTPGGGSLTLADASGSGNSFTWSGLPLGQYGLVERPLPPGYETYFIPGSAAVGGSPESGYSVAIDESAPDIGLTVYNFEPLRTGSVTVLVFDCPANMVPGDYAATACPPSSGPYDFRLAGSEASYSGADAAALDGGLQWTDVPYGLYGLRETAYPPGFGRTAAPGYSYNEGLDGYAVEVGDSGSNVTIKVYNFIPG